MNERIREIAQQACFDEIGKDYSLYFNLTKDKVEKFAELIIEDCINIVNKRKDAAIDASWNVDEAMTNAVWDIEEHFYKVWGKK